MAVTAALIAVAAGAYRFWPERSESTVASLDLRPQPVQPATQAILAADITDPLLLAISAQNPFDRGMALREVRSGTIAPKLRAEVHQIICDTLDDRAFSSIWSSAARALGEVGTPDDLSRLKSLIEQSPVQTQCAAMASAMVLDPRAGVKLFEPRAADDRYGATTAGYLADWGPRCEPVAVALLQSPQRMCRFHALFLLKAFGTPKALDALAKASHEEQDKLIATGYQFTIDAIHSRNQ